MLLWSRCTQMTLPPARRLTTAWKNRVHQEDTSGGKAITQRTLSWISLLLAVYWSDQILEVLRELFGRRRISPVGFLQRKQWEKSARLFDYCLYWGLGHSRPLRYCLPVKPLKFLLDLIWGQRDSLICLSWAVLMGQNQIVLTSALCVQHTRFSSKRNARRVKRSIVAIVSSRLLWTPEKDLDAKPPVHLDQIVIEIWSPRRVTAASVYPATKQNL